MMTAVLITNQLFSVSTPSNIVMVICVIHLFCIGTELNVKKEIDVIIVPKGDYCVVSM